MKISITATGGGSYLISELMSYGGASSYIEEVNIPYSREAINDFLGYTPHKYTSEETAKSLALKSLRRVEELTGTKECVGVGLCCSLSTGNQRKDRVNEAYIYCISSRGNMLFNKHLMVDNTAHRYFQEIDISDFFKGLIQHINSPGYIESEENLLTEAFQGGNVYIPINSPTPSKILYPGSFNPFHAGHEYIVNSMEEFGLVDLEISLTNVDKPALTVSDIEKRLNQSFPKNVGGIWLTNKPKFSDKINFFDNYDFVVGADTFNRIFQRKYYLDYEEFSRFEEDIEDVVLYIIPREGVILNQDTYWYDNWHYLSHLTPPNISSTQLREREGR